MRSKHPVRESLIFLACVLFAIFAAFPIYWMINTALSTDQELYTGQSLWPHLERVLDIPAFLSGSPAFAWLGNSAFIAFGTTFLSLIMAVHGAYALSRFKFFGKGAVGFLLFATQMLPEAVIVVPLFAVFAGFGLLNNLYGLVLATVGTAYGRVMMARKSARPRKGLFTKTAAAVPIIKAKNTVATV